MFILALFFGATSGGGVAHAAPLTLSQFQHAIHFDGNCTGAGCEGAEPPPINTCNGGGGSQVTPDYIDSGVITVTLYQYTGNNGGCMWAAVYFNCSQNCNSNSFVYVTAIGEWENSCDGSNVGGLDFMPVKLSNSRHWESTYMVATDTSDCPNGSNYHGAAYITDVGTSSPSYLQNTDTWYQ